MTSFAVNPLTPGLGARIDGIDVKTLDDAGFDRLCQTWLDYKVLFITEQRIELDDLLDFSRRFGELMRLPYIEPLDGYPDIIRVLKEAHEINMGTFGGDWHSDFSFLPAPPRASILFGEDIPAVGGDTVWIDMAQAWSRMPDELKTKVEGRSAIHAGKPYGTAHAPDEDTKFKGSIEIVRNNPEADREVPHPAVCRHPETGEEILFVNPTYTTRIDGYDAADSDRLLERLQQHYTRPEFSCRFKWEPGVIAIWDNRNTLHYAVNDYDGHRRCLYRTTIAGHPPRAAD